MTRLVAGRFGFYQMRFLARNAPGDVFFDLAGFYVARRSGIGLVEIAEFTPSQFRILLLLAASDGGFATYGQIIDYLYGDRADGGPDNTRDIITVTVCRIRPKISCLKLSIKTKWGFGLRLCAEPLESTPARALEQEGVCHV